MHTDRKKYHIVHVLITAVFALGALLLFSPEAEARIVVEGDREFTDDINECLNTYRNTAGIVGDVIKELENSKNNHKITESPDWENVSNDGAKAENGTGTGTHTKVSKEKIEELKKEIDELKNKDFCTALLHELWHAVDADRGSWSNNKKNDVWEDEIEATMFQNFIHALRGVPPRTTYRHDISEFLLLTDREAGKTKESVEVLVLKGSYFPKSQFRIELPDACDADHYHGDKVFGFKIKTSSEIVSMSDLNPSPCGFGKVSEVAVERIDITIEQSAELLKNIRSEEQTSPPPALPTAPKTPGGKIIVCGLPGGPACPR